VSVIAKMDEDTGRGFNLSNVKVSQSGDTVLLGILSVEETTLFL
jgi:hypothetical protein